MLEAFWKRRKESFLFSPLSLLFLPSQRLPPPSQLGREALNAFTDIEDLSFSLKFETFLCAF